MKTIRIWFVLVVLGSMNAWAYKEASHADLSEQAVRQSVLDQPGSGILLGLGLGQLSNDSSSHLPVVGGSPRALIVQGAVAEDRGIRSLNHFFDPQRGGTGLPIPTAHSSPDWALESGQPIDAQAFSYQDAKERLLSALTGPTEAIRRQNLGGVFESLGHTVHHIQDMHQPQHVRTDDHCDLTQPILTVFGFVVIDSLCKELHRYRPSAYEQYVHEQGEGLGMTGYPIPDYATFDAPRKFWESDAGGAAFTSNNFVSVRTNFTLDTSSQPIAIRSNVDHPWPRGSDAQLTSVDINDPGFVRRVTEPMPMAGHISYVATPMVDNYQPSFNGLNPYSSALSIWYDSIRLSSGEVLATPSTVFTLNSVNYETAARMLLPRAAAYSTGLINYFFRGRIGIELPSEGVYGIVDHATTYAAGQGFGKLKLKLRNASPDGVKPSGEAVPQTMQGGTLVAVAKYTLNSCYLPDLTGDFAVAIDTGQVFEPAGCSLDQYFAGDEQISQSAALLAVTLDKAAADVVFDFSSQPIPINARDLRIQVVYTGQLGAEADGIAFGGRDISEPTHLIVYNNSDYYAVDGKFYTPQQIRSDAALSQRVQGRNIDPKPLDRVALAVVPGKPLTEPTAPVSVGVHGYVRMAVLADIDRPFPLSVLTRFEGGGESVTTFGGIWANTTELRSEPAYITPFGIYRGTRGHFVDVVFKANNTTPLQSGELETMSGRTVADPGPTSLPLRF